MNRYQIMKDYNHEIRDIAEIYFDKKIKNANISEEIKDKIWQAVEDLIEDMQEMSVEVDREIDEIIEKETAEYNPSFYEEMEQDNAFRQNELYETYCKT